MKIYHAEQIRQADAHTLSAQGIPSHLLMERASGLASRHLANAYPEMDKILIVCGTGNNGGDGVCMARQLTEMGREVTILVIGDPSNGSADFKLNYQRLASMPIRRFFWQEDKKGDFDFFDGVVDALFGTGINRPVEGRAAKVIEAVNASGLPVISIDMPSGWMCDQVTEGAYIQATHTFTFEWPKLSFFLPEAEQAIGRWEVISIGLEHSFPGSDEEAGHYIDHELVAQLYCPRSRFMHKGNLGHVMMVAGSEGMPGAGSLSAFAALTTGAGLVTLASDNCQLVYPEIMCCSRTECLKRIADQSQYTLGIGPGLGTDESAAELLKEILKASDRPVVIDADALNILSMHPKWLRHLPKGSILTPHPGEFGRLAGKSEHTTDEWEKQLNLAKESGAIVILKRAYTSIAFPSGQFLINSTGNPGMSTAGSGDVLTGMITGLLAQGYSPEKASVMGVYLHGLAGDLAMEEQGGQNITASKLIDYIQEAYQTLIA